MVVLDNCALFEILRKSDRGRALQELLMVEEKVISVELIRAEAVSVLRKLVVTGKVTKGDAGSMQCRSIELELADIVVALATVFGTDDEL